MQNTKIRLKSIAFLLLISGNLFSQEINKEKIDEYINYVENNNGGIASLSIYKDGQQHCIDPGSGVWRSIQTLKHLLSGSWYFQLFLILSYRLSLFFY